MKDNHETFSKIVAGRDESLTVSNTYDEFCSQDNRPTNHCYGESSQKKTYIKLYAK